MFTTYDDAIGRFKTSGSKDPQVVGAIAAGMRNPLKLIRLAAIAFTIPSTAATLLIIGAIIGIPGLIACAIVITKANKALTNIDSAQKDWIASP